MPQTSNDIERIVREVIARLGDCPSFRPSENGTVPFTAVKKSAPQAESAKPQAANELLVSSRVVTMAEIGPRLDGVRRVVVAPGAIVTPSVREELQKRQIGLVSTAADPRGTKPAVGLIVIATGTIDPEPLARTLGRDGIETEKLDCLISACDTLAERIASGGVLGVLLTVHTAAAMCLANRLPGVRAVLGVSADTVAGDAVAVGANLLVVDPSSRGFWALKQITDRFVQSGPLPCPDILKKRLA
jgi:hypothetical protein